MAKRTKMTMADAVTETEDVSGGVNEEAWKMIQAHPSPRLPSPLPASSSSPPPKAELILVKLADIEEGANVRRSMDEPALLQLAGTMREVGLMAPVVVCKSAAGGRHELIAGYRRLTAARRNGDAFIEAKVYPPLAPALKVRMQLVENLQHEDPSHIDYALQFGRSRDEGMSAGEIAAVVGKSDDFVRKHLDLLRLAPAVQELVASGRLPLKQAELIARVGDHAAQMELTSGVIRATWNEKKNAWQAYGDKTDGGGGPHGQVGAGPAGDYAEDMDSLRKAVSYKMQGLVACGWIKGEDQEGGEPFAEKAKGSTGLKCTGCPDNSATYSDQPALFAGLTPHGSDKRGFCTNAACYEAKSIAWEKVRAEKKLDEEQRQRAAATKARKAGLDVCEADGCGRIAPEGEKFKACKELGGAKACPSCAASARKRGEGRGGRGESHAQRPFPQTPEEKYAVAVVAYAEEVLERVGKWVEKWEKAELASKAPNWLRHSGMTAELLCLAAVKARARHYGGMTFYLTIPLSSKEFPASEAIRKALLCPAGEECVEMPEGFLVGLVGDERFPAAPRWVSYDKRVVDVPMPPKAEEYLQCLEAFAARYHVELPEAPKEEPGQPVNESTSQPAVPSPEVKKRLTTVATGGRKEALAALAKCGVEDLEAVRGLQNLKGDWRRAAVTDWIRGAEGPQA